MYALGLAWPEKFWGFHYLAFIPPPFAWALLGLSILPLVPAVRRLAAGFFDKLDSFSGKAILLIAAILIAATVVTWFYTEIGTYVYGDSRQYAKIQGQPDEFKVEYLINLASPDIFSPKNQILFGDSLARLIRYAGGFDIKTVFAILNSACGGLFLIFFTIFIFRLYESGGARIFFILLAIGAGFAQFFFTHLEIYSISLSLFSIYFCLLGLFFISGKKKWLIFSAIALFFSIKSHSAGFALAPSYVIALLSLIRNIREDTPKYLSARKLAIYAVAPSAVIFAIIYFLALGAHDNSHLIHDVSEFKQIFLPLIPVEGDITQYTMFSAAHLFDMANVITAWGIPSIFLIFSLIRAGKGKAPHKLAMPAAFGLSALYFAGLFFTANPLLSMPRDFDLFSLAGPSLLFYSAAKYRIAGKEKKGLIAPALALTLLAIPMFAVNSNKEMASHRLEKTGEHVYYTYWKNSSFIIHAGINMEETDDEFIRRFEDLFRRMPPIDTGRPDPEYATLLNALAEAYFAGYQFSLAAGAYENAGRYYPGNTKILSGLALSNYAAGNMKGAFETSAMLVNMGAAGREETLVCIEAAYELKQYDTAEKLAGEYLKSYPNDTRALELLRDIRDMRK